MCRLLWASSKWGEKYSQISRRWRQHWENENILFNYSPDIRKENYTINVIESLDNVTRLVTKKYKVFPTDDFAKRLYAVGRLGFRKVDEAHKKLEGGPE